MNKRDSIAPQPILLRDYVVPAFLLDRVDLTFELDETSTRVSSRLVLHRNPDHPVSDADLVLDGHELMLESVLLDGEPMSTDRYDVDDESLTIKGLGESAILEITTRIEPQKNTSLMGLYKSNGNFFTQCEAEGFRKITYYLDRPDVMTRFTTTIIADRSKYPVLLSNGNRVGEGQYDRNRHWVKWVDPFKKPSYLFALVAGKLSCLQDSFTTRSGRKVALEIYVEPQDLEKCHHAMESVKRSMKWDEDVYGLEYDLDSYMIVAVSDFNMGAMENKGLNIFNTKYVLARPETATDADYMGVEAVIAHEYFHNWTGNRVTCRDWFQLSLKEGLTVFRDQEFTADMTSRAVKRIDDVRTLRTAQFAEDASPMAHPVRPDSYIEINNFYTVTIYEKGAEVVRMYHTLLGAEGYRKGIDLYFKRHDGQAVTCDDFASAMGDANGFDFAQFKRWYSQAGTPVVKVVSQFDAANQTYTLDISQTCPPTPGQPEKLPFHIPIALGLLDAAGAEIPLQLAGEASPQGTTRVLQLTEASQRFVFTGISAQPTPSLLRGFSAPVKLDYPWTRQELAFLMAHDSDSFCRWEASHTLIREVLLELIAAARASEILSLPGELVDAMRRALLDEAADPALIALMFTLPAETYLADQVDEIHPDAIRTAREYLRVALAKALRSEFKHTYARFCGATQAYRYAAVDIAKRALKNVCLGYLTSLDEPAFIELAQTQFQQANNMTDSQAALAALVELPQGATALADFANRWQDDPLVMNKWFTLQAMDKRADALDRVRALQQHPAFQITNPNKVYALLATFCSSNLAGFHRADGAGYAFAAEQILVLDKLNPQVASRLARSFNRWKKLEPTRRAQAKTALEKLAAHADLSRDVFEIISKNLA